MSGKGEEKRRNVAVLLLFDSIVCLSCLLLACRLLLLHSGAGVSAGTAVPTSKQSAFSNAT